MSKVESVEDEGSWGADHVKTLVRTGFHFEWLRKPLTGGF